MAGLPHKAEGHLCLPLPHTLLAYITHPLGCLGNWELPAP